MWRRVGPLHDPLVVLLLGEVSMVGVRTRLRSILTSLPSGPHHIRTRSKGLVVGLTARTAPAFSGYHCQPRQTDRPFGRLLGQRR